MSPSSLFPPPRSLRCSRAWEIWRWIIMKACLLTNPAVAGLWRVLCGRTRDHPSARELPHCIYLSLSFPHTHSHTHTLTPTVSLSTLHRNAISTTTQIHTELHRPTSFQRRRTLAAQRWDATCALSVASALPYGDAMFPWDFWSKWNLTSSQCLLRTPTPLWWPHTPTGMLGDRRAAFSPRSV